MYIPLIFADTLVVKSFRLFAAWQVYLPLSDEDTLRSVKVCDVPKGVPSKYQEKSGEGCPPAEHVKIIPVPSRKDNCGGCDGCDGCGEIVINGFSKSDK